MCVCVCVCVDGVMENEKSVKCETLHIKAHKVSSEHAEWVLAYFRSPQSNDPSIGACLLMM